jgi:predicted nucleic acid-binding protein
VFCRPFDDQSFAKVHDEAQAFARILDKVNEAKVTLAGSELLVFEIQRIIEADKRAKVVGYLRLIDSYHIMTEETLSLGKRITAQFKLQPRDALHAASALFEESKYFLSCDDGITKRFQKRPLFANIGHQPRRLKVMNPVAFVKEMRW